MPLRRVYISADVYMVCLQHALSTDQEEVMGLLIGDIDNEEVSHISASVMLRRSDKRKDRVEISPEQLTNAAIQADKLAHELCKPMRVIGWYHSHPHITVWPSHVDVRTQAMYQTMDENFIGIIISVFSEDKASKEQQVQMIAFQSVNSSNVGQPPDYTQVEVPLYIHRTFLSRPCLQTMVELPEILFQEEQDSYDFTAKMSYLSVVAKLINKSVLTKSLFRITDEVSKPLVTSLEQRKATNMKRLIELRKEREYLLSKKSES